MIQGSFNKNNVMMTIEEKYLLKLYKEPSTVVDTRDKISSLPL